MTEVLFLDIPTSTIDIITATLSHTTSSSHTSISTSSTVEQPMSLSSSTVEPSMSLSSSTVEPSMSPFPTPIVTNTPSGKLMI